MYIYIYIKETKQGRAKSACYSRAMPLRSPVLRPLPCYSHQGWAKSPLYSRAKPLRWPVSSSALSQIIVVKVDRSQRAIHAQCLCDCLSPTLFQTIVLKVERSQRAIHTQYLCHHPPSSRVCRSCRGATHSPFTTRSSRSTCPTAHCRRWTEFRLSTRQSHLL